jgi:hypothetical protein
MSVRAEQVRVTEPAKLVTTSGDVARRAQQRFAFRRVSQQGKRKRGSRVLQGARGIGSTVMDVGECGCVRINKVMKTSRRTKFHNMVSAKSVLKRCK